MKTSFCFLLLFLAALFFSGCRTSEVHDFPAPVGKLSSDGQSVRAVVKGENYGLYLFGVIPLWCGDPRRPNSRHYITCRDRVSDRYSRRMLESWAQRRFPGCSIADYRSQEFFSGWYTLFLVWHKTLLSQADIVPLSSPKSIF